MNKEKWRYTLINIDNEDRQRDEVAIDLCVESGY